MNSPNVVSNGDTTSKEVVFYPALLSQAHDEKLCRIRTRLIQFPSEANRQTAVAKAAVETSRGTFEALGTRVPKTSKPFWSRT